MPKWVKHTLWAFLVIVLIARWREVGGWLKDLAAGIGGFFKGDALGFDDPIYRFAVFGVLVVAVVALWTVYWNNRSG